MNRNENDVVILNLDRPREVRFGFGAIKRLLAGENMNIEDLESGNIDLTNIERFMFYGLQADAKRNDETLNFDDMEDLLDQGNFGEVIDAFQTALSLGFAGIGDEGNALRAQQPKKAKAK